MIKTFAGVLALNYLAFALMACAMRRHRNDIAGSDQPCLPIARQWWLRAAGGALLLLALYLAILREGSTFGALLWALLISLAAILVALTLTWRPGWLAWLLRGVKHWAG